jgi:hypothetical protein
MKTLLLIGSPVSLYQRSIYKTLWRNSDLIKGDLYYFSNKKYTGNNLPPDNIHLVENRAYNEAKTWEIKKLVLDAIFEKYKFDRIVIYKNPYLSQISYGQEDKVEKFYLEKLKGEYGFNFMVELRRHDYALPVVHLAYKYKLPVIYLLYDPMEFDLNKVLDIRCRRYLFYDSKQIDAHFMPITINIKYDERKR